MQADFLSGMWAHYAQEMLNTLDAGDIEEAMNAASAVGDDKLQMQRREGLFPMLLHMARQHNEGNGSARDGRQVILEKGDTFSADI